MSLSDTGFERKTKRTRKREFFAEMNLVVQWNEPVALISPHAPAPSAKGGRPPFAVQTMLRIQVLQQWFNRSDPAKEEALYDTPLFRDFMELDAGVEKTPDESTILRFRHRLAQHGLGQQILATVDATLIAAPSSTKNSTGERGPEMHQTKKTKQWYFGMKAHINVNAPSGLVQKVVGTAANAHDITQASELLQGDETDVFADSGYRGLAKNTAQLHTLFALSNIWMVRRTLLKAARG